jgi:hypothetical protein
MKLKYNVETVSELFQAHYNNHRHDRNYANEKVVLANHRTRTEHELRDGGFCVVVEMFIRDPDKHADASGETKGFRYRLAQQPVTRRADLVKQYTAQPRCAKTNSGD